MKMSKMVGLVVFLHLANIYGYLFGCDDNSDGGRAEAGMEAGTDARSPFPDAGRKSGWSTTCCVCPLGDDDNYYNDAGFNQFIYDQYHDAEWSVLHLFVFCFKKGTDCR